MVHMQRLILAVFSKQDLAGALAPAKAGPFMKTDSKSTVPSRINAGLFDVFSYKCLLFLDLGHR